MRSLHWSHTWLQTETVVSFLVLASMRVCSLHCCIAACSLHVALQRLCVLAGLSCAGCFRSHGGELCDMFICPMRRC